MAVFAADWRMIWWSRTWAALLGDPSVVAPEERNFLIQCFATPGHAAQFVSWPVHSGDQAMTDRATVADMRRASVRYPEDGRLTELIQRTLEGNERFAELWRTGAVGVHTEDRKTIQHPVVGDVTVDCDVLYAGDADLRIVAMTAAAGSEDAGKIDLARVTGTTFAR